jgi:hypothetical protein
LFLFVIHSRSLSLFDTIKKKLQQKKAMDSASRQDAFKARGHFKPEEVRRRRETAQVEIRKQKKEENLAKRRNFNAQDYEDDSDEEDDNLQEEQVNIKSCLACW